MDWEIFWESVRVVVLVILRGEEEASFISSQEEERRENEDLWCLWMERSDNCVSTRVFSKKKSRYDSESERPFRATNEHFLHIGTSSQNKDDVV